MVGLSGEGRNFPSKLTLVKNPLAWMAPVEHVLGDSIHLQIALLYFRATLSHWGMTVMWVGGWNCLTEGRNKNYNTNAIKIFDLEYYPRTWAYIALGLVLSIFACNLCYQSGRYSRMFLEGFGEKGKPSLAYDSICDMQLGFLGCISFGLGYMT
eukprot:m.273875 g.273875  ORF g.273875 m.273875 type:complete len:154 (-) comp16282_c7_seq36:920-1381(-)